MTTDGTESPCAKKGDGSATPDPRIQTLLEYLPLTGPRMAAVVTSLQQLRSQWLSESKAIPSYQTRTDAPPGD